MIIGRRNLLTASVGGFTSLLLARLLAPTAALAKGPGKAKSIIVLWMNGGPSHLDTWDPKPGTPTGGPTMSRKSKS